MGYTFLTDVGQGIQEDFVKPYGCCPNEQNKCLNQGIIISCYKFYHI